jgi:hypothetical protein
MDIGGKTRRKETTRKAKTCVDNTKIYLKNRMGWYGLD